MILCALFCRPLSFIFCRLKLYTSPPLHRFHNLAFTLPPRGLETYSLLLAFSLRDSSAFLRLSLLDPDYYNLSLMPFSSRSPQPIIRESSGAIMCAQNGEINVNAVTTPWPRSWVYPNLRSILDVGVLDLLGSVRSGCTVSNSTVSLSFFPPSTFSYDAVCALSPPGSRHYSLPRSPVLQSGLSVAGFSWTDLFRSSFDTAIYPSVVLLVRGRISPPLRFASVLRLVTLFPLLCILGSGGVSRPIASGSFVPATP